MDFDEASDEIDKIQQTLGLAARIDAFRRRSGELEVGEDGRAEFLASLAGDLELNGDVDDARAAYLEAINDGGPTELEPRCGLLSIELMRPHAEPRIRTIRIDSGKQIEADNTIDITARRTGSR